MNLTQADLSKNVKISEVGFRRHFSYLKSLNCIKQFSTIHHATQTAATTPLKPSQGLAETIKLQQFDQGTLNFDQCLQLMIKGKKIESVSLQLLAGGRNGPKQGGFAIGKEFILEKRQLVSATHPKHNQNQEDLHLMAEKDILKPEQDQVTHIQAAQTARNQETDNKYPGRAMQHVDRVGSKVVKTEKEGKERSQNKKQNKMMNSKSTKQINSDPKKEELTAKSTKTEQRNASLKEAMPKKTKSPAPNVPRQPAHKVVTKAQAENRKPKEIEEFTSEAAEMDQEQLQSERIQSPNPITDTCIEPTKECLEPAKDCLEPTKDYLQQISFGTHQHQIRLPQVPLKYECSDEEDMIQPGQVLFATQNDQPGSSQVEETEHGLSLSSELFALTAEQLLAKDYFCI